MDPAPSPSTLLPGFPRIHAPHFPLLEAEGVFGAQAPAARQLHRLGYVKLDLGRDRLAGLARRIRADLEGRFDLQGWRAAGATGDLRVQDGWRQSAAVRELALLPELLTLLEQLWGRKPFAFQTLNFPVGTRQHLHSDAVHFHSEPAGFLCGVWVALEDVHPDAGPLEYVPGSQDLPYLQARDVGVRQQPGVIPDQSIFHGAWQACLEAHGLERQTFTPRLGEALIWTANLLHGGAPVHDPGRTRWSQVTHYFFEGCQWYTPMRSDWPSGPVAWRRPLDVASGIEVVAAGAAAASPALATADALLQALAGGDLAAAATALAALMEPLGQLLPGAWEPWISQLEAAGVAGRLQPLLEELAHSAQEPESPALRRWSTALAAGVPQGAVDQLLRIGPGHWLAFGWRAAAEAPELVVLGCDGHWSLHPLQAEVRLCRRDVAEALASSAVMDSGLLGVVRLPGDVSLAGIWLDGRRQSPLLLDLEGAPYLEAVDDLLRRCLPDATPIQRLPALLEAGLGEALLKLRRPLQEAAAWPAQIAGQYRYGPEADQAEVTLVVPLYRRWDFVLGQLAGFALDPLFLSGRARLLYVVDDPTIAAEFLGWCENQLPEEPLAVEVIQLRRNFGFAMACNLGVLQAGTPLVCLLNSDVLPISPGWLEPLLQAAAEEPEALVAPLLLYDTGQIQHAGMVVHWPGAERALPACSHPRKGLDPGQLERGPVEALSGAALLVDRQRLLAVGGLDPAFGRGDFEDLELSLRWRRHGWPLRLVPEARLTHLERQSISRTPDALGLWRQAANAWLARALCPELVPPVP